MDISIASARPQDEDFLWVMIYYAAHMEQDGAASLCAAQEHPYLQKYVAGWGGPSDVGVIGYDGSKPIGAVWSRLMIGDNKTYGYVDDDTPELAAAVLPEYIGKGAGTKLLRSYLDKAKDLFPAVTLTVRADNPALRLYQRAGFAIIKEITNRVGKNSYHMILHFADIA
jgi:ribosomal protein S18 acetylase RimI-like enzyme